MDTRTETALDGAALVDAVERIATEAGERLLTRWSPSNRVADLPALIEAIRANEGVAEEGLRPALERLRPDARWAGEEQQTAPLPHGEWWVVDSVEGNVNHVHGLPEWGVSVALVRDGDPVLAVFRQPVGDRTWAATRGGGATVRGERLSVSGKRALELAVVGTGQAEVGQAGTYAAIGASVTAMLHAALLVRTQVPSTFPMLLVAGGHLDAFWQFQPNLPGTAAGVLMVQEAGGVATTLAGAPWRPGADGLLVAAPGVHAAALAVLGAAA